MQQPARPSADIIRIPVSPQARLLAAVRMLELRLAEQRHAVAGWRDDLGRLSALLGTIGGEAEVAMQRLTVPAQPPAAEHRPDAADQG